MGRLTRRRSVLAYGPAGPRRRSDLLAVEEPLEIRVGGIPHQVTMRTPGHDVELVHGLLYSEQVITSAEQISLARYCAGVGEDGVNTYNVLDVTLAAGVPAPDAAQHRHVTTTSACGLCGATSIEQVTRGAKPLAPGPEIAAEVISSAPVQLRPGQRVFEQTGGVHAAGLFTAEGKLLCVREDVGRHNAVDKVIGWALREGRLPLSEHLLCVSSRASFELTQKAVLAGVPVLAAVSAPSSLAVELATEAGLTLVGFVRGGSFNVYAHPDRVRSRSGVRSAGA